MVVKGGAVLERLARCTHAAAGQDRHADQRPPVGVGGHPGGTGSRAEILRLAASLDQVSGHVLAGAVVAAAARRGCELVLPERRAEVPGQGIRGLVDGHQVAVGKAGLGRGDAACPDGPRWRAAGPGWTAH